MIEEPPANTIFLLISENPDRVIGTIQSRTQSLPVPPIDGEAMKQALQKIASSSETEALELVHLANGSYLKALELIENSEGNRQHLELFKSIMRNCWRKDLKNMRTEAENFAGIGREKQKSFLSYAGNMMRENFFYRLNIPQINYLNREETDFSKNFSPYVNENNITDLIGELALAERHIESNVNPRMVFFDLSMKIAVLIKK